MSNKRNVLRILCLLALCLAHSAAARSADLPSGFVERQITNALNQPTLMQFAPDGRLFVAEQDGRIRVIKDGALLPDPLLTIPGVHFQGERGLMGLAFDPEFTETGYLYAYYTVDEPYLHHRVSRFTVTGDSADPSSEFRLIDMDDMSGASNPWHAGGALNFGADGTLYVLTGDNTERDKAQSLASTFGKILRINRDGSIPEDNPFHAQTEGIYRAIWALGLRNPFNGSVQPGTGLFYVNDVGEETWEEINEAVRGANYGWPEVEGVTNDPRFTSPVHAYIHNGTDCAITGSAFYNPPAPTFPAEFHGKYFYADFCAGWIRTFEPQTKTVEEFARSAGTLTALRVSPSGHLYYLLREEHAILRIEWSGTGVPIITADPVDLTAKAGGSADFTCTASGDAPLTIQWQRNQMDIPDATSETLTLSDVSLTDSGARFRCVVTNTSGSATSAEATLWVTTNLEPAVTIVSPADGSSFEPGQVVRYSGSATDPEDGELPASAFTWQIDLGHGHGAEEHFHPLLPPTMGATAGEIQVSASGHTSRDIHYRFRLTAIDSAGAATMVESRMFPAPLDVPSMLQAEHAASGSGTPAPAGMRLMSAGDFVYDSFHFPQTGAYTFVITASGDYADGEWPTVLVKIDGTIVGSAVVSSIDVTQVSVAAHVDAGIHGVRLEFPNDFWDGVNDRNLFVDGFSIQTSSGGGAGELVAVRSLVDENRFMDVSGALQEAATPLITWLHHGDVNQLFDIRSNGEIAVYGAMCVTTRDPEGPNGDDVVIAPCAGQPNQQWTPTATGEIRGIHDRCLDVFEGNAAAGTKLIIWDCHGGRNQKWELIPAPAR